MRGHGRRDTSECQDREYPSTLAEEGRSSEVKTRVKKKQVVCVYECRGRLDDEDSVYQLRLGESTLVCPSETHTGVRGHRGPQWSTVFGP